MKCPKCKKTSIRLISENDVNDNKDIKRVYKCLDCGEIFTTFETTKSQLQYEQKILDEMLMKEVMYY